MAGKGKLVSRVKEVQKKSVGTRVRYYGLGGQKMECPVCHRACGSGMVSEYGKTFYCSEKCVLAVAEDQ